LRPRFSILAHQLRRRFQSCCSLLRGARLIYWTARPEGSLVFRLARPDLSGAWSPTEVLNLSSRPKRPDVPRPFLGNLYRVPLRSPPASLRRGWQSGAASHDRKIPLPAPLPGWPRVEPESSSHCLPAEIGPSVACRVLLAVSGLPGRRGLPSRSPEHHAPLIRVAEAKYLVRSLWITGISGTTVRTFPDSHASGVEHDSVKPPELPFRSPPPTSAGCLNRRSRLPNPLTCRG